MIDTPFAFAFAAGLVATINPCGFAMLPAYLSYFMGLGGGGDAERPSETMGMGKSLVVGAVVSCGFLLVFGVTGALITAGLRSVIDYVPWLALGVGIVITALGIAMLAFGFEPTIGLPKLERGGSSRSYRSVFLFGVSYAIASLSCGLPVFLAVVGTATATSNFASGALTFVTYGVGMSMLVVALTITLAFAKEGLLRWLRSAMRHMNRLSGAVMVLAGAYITVYWIVNLNDPLGGRGATFQVVERFQRTVADQLGGRPAFWALLLAALISVVVASTTMRSRRGESASESRQPDVVLRDREVEERRR